MHYSGSSWESLTDDERSYLAYVSHEKYPVSFEEWLKQMHYDGAYDPENPKLTPPDYDTLEA